MEKIQIPKVSILLPIFFVGLLFLTPFLSTSMRSSYILNLLVVFLGLEAGFLSSTSKSLDESEKHNIFNTVVATYTTTSLVNTSDAHESVQPQIVPVEQIAKQEMVKKDTTKMCKSRPSIFFIGSHELEIGSVEKNEEAIIVKEMEGKIIPMKGVDKEEEINNHELNMMAETFIGNFYRQLKVDAEVLEISKEVV